MAGIDLARAADFMWRNARVLERRLFAHIFLGGSQEGVVAALRAYQNDDGGFGHALEPDLRGPDSQPIHVDMAFRVLHEVGAVPPEVLARASSYLMSVTSDEGGVPAIGVTAENYPRADHWHWQNWPADSINPTAMLAGLLHALRYGHPWLDRADAFCWRLIEAADVEGGPALAAAFCFLNNAADRRRAVAAAEGLAEKIPEADFFTLQPGGSDDYALTPLHLAPTEDAMARGLFTDDLIEAHLDHLAAEQQDDGGWPLTWHPPGEGAAIEWRGRVTLEALLLLHWNGRV
jgi:hypothetical protein